MEQVTVTAHAKINLGLRIHRKREDGYHDIETIFHRVQIADTIRFSPSHNLTFSCNDHLLSQEEDNLCLRAAELLKKEGRLSHGVRIELLKEIPIGAGLGGGSADAAATLFALNNLWNLNLDIRHLQQIALSLGSDIPYFLRQGTAYATGRGEILEYFPEWNFPYWIAVVYPNVHVSTAWAYGKVQPSNRGPSLRLLLEERVPSVAKIQNLLRNDFEPAVFSEYPEIAVVRDTLVNSGAFLSQLSGSGSSVFGLFDDEDQAKEAMKLFPPAYRIFLTPPSFRPSYS